MTRTNFSLTLILLLGVCLLTGESITPRGGGRTDHQKAIFLGSSRIQQQDTQILPTTTTTPLDLILFRGGSDSELDEYDEDEEEEEEDGIESSSSTALDKILNVSKKSLLLGIKITKKVVKAMERAIKAGLEDDTEKEDQSVVTKVVSTISRMIKAALTFDDDNNSNDNDEDDDESPLDEDANEDNDDDDDEVSEIPKVQTSDFGSFLSKAYNVADDRGPDGPRVLGGTLANALEIARSQARMLIVFIPSKRPSKKNKLDKDELAIRSILSSQVATGANKLARKKGETGSFLFWGAKAGSSEATAAMKRLKTKATSQKGEKRPILAVVYPAQKTASGIPYGGIIPKVLAQHHCSPPPSESLMASWLDSLRKRHAKQYAAMQKILKEAQYSKERLEGYTESVKSDKERKVRQAQEEAQQLAKEKAEKERQQAIETRRQELKESLPEEDTSDNAKKIALRFADGRSGQRRFSPDQPVSDVFNWVDAHYEMERELVVLTTMNGKMTLEWDGDESHTSKSLQDVGLGKNTGFRVTEKKETVQSDEEEEKAEDDDDDTEDSEESS